MDYQEKLRLAKEALDSGSYDKETIEYIFPELKNSEDDRVRKCLITFFRRFPYDSIVNAGTNAKEALAWLENQGHDGKKWIYEDVYLKEKEQLIQDGIDEVLENPQKYGLEKQGEQKPDNKAESMEYNYITPNPEFFQWIYDRLVHVHNENPNVDFMLSLKERIEDMQKPFDKCEPKFKVGDWVVTPKNQVYQITSIEGTSYRFNNESTYWEICYCDEQCHLWTIEDAKDGDVLSDGTTIFIFKDLLSDGSVMSYCDYDTDSGESDAFCPLSVNLMCSKITPATKERRDTLMEAIADAGYTFDFDKKELKKIEQRPTEWSEEDEEKLNSIIEVLGEDSLLVNWLKSLKPQQNQYDKGYNDGYSASKYNHWKPSEEQIKSLRIALQTMPYSKDKENVLVILEELLKI